MNQFHTLLIEIKSFLSANLQIKGAFPLLAKLDAYLDNINQILEINQSDKNQQNLKIKQAQFMIIPNENANILDSFILEYSFVGKQYQIIGGQDQNINKIQARKAIQSLILGKLDTHCKPKQKTTSMTQLHKLITNISSNSTPLILPNYIGQSYKYTYIFQVQECVEFEDAYYLIDRYYCFVTDGIVDESLELLVKKIRAEIFQHRVVNAHDPNYVNVNFTMDCVRGSLGRIQKLVREHTLYLNDPPHQLWIEREHKFYARQSKKTINSCLLTMCIYFLICNYKMAFLVSKQEKHKLSDIVLSIQAAIRPLNFPCPVAFCTFERENPNFIDSPFPVVIGYWGIKAERKQFVNYCMRLKDAPKVDTVVIDLQKNSIVYDVGISSKDIGIIQKLNKQTKKYGKGQTLVQKTSLFIEQTLQKMSSYNEKAKQKQWPGVLHEKIHNSQAFNKIK